MSLKKKRAGFTFDDSSVRTLDELQAQGLFDGPEVEVVKVTGYRNCTLRQPRPQTLEDLLDRLDAAKWCVKFTTIFEQGQRRHIARVWKLDGLGGSKKTSGVSRLEALTRAYEDAKRVRHQRARQQQGRGEVAASTPTGETP